MISDDIVKQSLDIYSSLKFRSANPNQYTIFASIALASQNSSQANLKVVSLATGVKCLPESRFSSNGDTIHDCHAEILARRGFIRWLLEEVGRTAVSESTSSTRSTPSLWIERHNHGDIRKWSLKKGLTLHLYISTIPCGDASTRTLSLLPQDPEIAALKNAQRKAENESRVLWPFVDSNIVGPTRGREDYTLFGVLRTKPGRGDAEPSFSMSCSDKIARWSILGIQGALLTTLFDPIYIDEIIIGGVEDGYRDMVQEDCRRAFWERFDCERVKDILPPFKLHSPTVTFTTLVFPFAREIIEKRLEPGTPSSSSNECLCWIADSERRPGFEILINGLRRGVNDRQRLKPALCPLVSKLSLLALYQQTLPKLNLPLLSPQTTYGEAKLAASSYQKAKDVLRKDDGPFLGWLISDKKWENFTVLNPL